MRTQLIGRNRHPVAPDITGARHRQIDVSPAAHADEPGERRHARQRRHLAETLLDVRRLKAAQNLDRDSGMHGIETLQNPSEPPRREARRARQADAALQGLGVLHEGFDQRFVGAQDRFDPLQGGLSGVRQRERPRRVPDELAPQALLQGRDRAGDARDLHVQHLRRARERPRLREDDEGAPGIEVVDSGHPFLRGFFRPRTAASRCFSCKEARSRRGFLRVSPDHSNLLCFAYCAK